METGSFHSLVLWLSHLYPICALCDFGSVSKSGNSPPNPLEMFHACSKLWVLEPNSEIYQYPVLYHHRHSSPVKSRLFVGRTDSGHAVLSLWVFIFRQGSFWPQGFCVCFCLSITTMSYSLQLYLFHLPWFKSPFDGLVSYGFTRQCCSRIHTPKSNR